MAFLQCNFFSETLRVAVSFNGIVPVPRKGETGGEYPVLYLLHGLSDDHTIWSRRTSIERYVEKRDLIVIMPAVNRSFYRNMAQGPNYYDYMTEELPRVVKGLFPASDKREDTFIAGLSMGGYGAFNIALKNPQRYSKAASMSGVMDIKKIIEDRGRNDREYLWIFGDPKEFNHKDDDLYSLIAKLKTSGSPVTSLYQCCGTEDSLYEDNRAFKAYLEKMKVDFTYNEEPAAHTWDYWDRKIKDIIDWIFE